MSSKASRGTNRLLWAGAFVICLAAAYPQTLWEWWATDGIPDATAEKLTGWAALNDDAYTPIPEIADNYGTEIETWGHLHPRPPAALLVQTLLIPVPDRWLLLVIAIVTSASLVGTFWVSHRFIGGPVWPWLAGAAVLSISWFEYRRGNLWMVLAGALLAFGWWNAHRWWGQLLLGVTAAVKLWPFVVLATMLRTERYRTASFKALLWALGLTVVGLMLPGVSISGATEALSSSMFVDAPGNWTFAGFLARRGFSFAVPVAATVGAGAWWFLTKSGRADQKVAWSVIVGLAASPLAWPPYWLAAAPAAALLVLSRLETEFPVESSFHPIKPTRFGDSFTPE